MFWFPRFDTGDTGVVEGLHSTWTFYTGCLEWRLKKYCQFHSLPSRRLVFFLGQYFDRVSLSKRSNEEAMGGGAQESRQRNVFVVFFPSPLSFPVFSFDFGSAFSRLYPLHYETQKVASYAG